MSHFIAFRGPLALADFDISTGATVERLVVPTEGSPELPHPFNIKSKNRKTPSRVSQSRREVINTWAVSHISVIGFLVSRKC
jgi:hypothetical protein